MTGDTLVFLNGEYLPLSQAKVSVLDRGFLFADAVYEVIPVYQHQPFHPESHLTRLNQSLAAIDMRPPLTHEQWLGIFKRLINSRTEANLSLYCQVTRGAASTRHHPIPKQLPPTVFACTFELKQKSHAELAQGIAVITLDDIRWAYCDIKSTALLANVLLQHQANQQQATEAVLIQDGLVIEGTSSNVFIVKDGTLITPAKSNQLLGGITREIVIELANTHQIPCIERALTASELTQADEIWVTSSTKEITPVVKLNGQTVGQGKPGALWEIMIQHYRAFKTAL